VASNWTALTSGAPLSHSIDADETGQPIAGVGQTPEVWTGTTTSGALQADGCGSFTLGLSTLTVYVGLSGPTDLTWTEVYPQFCNRTNVHLYRIEQ